MDAIRPGCILPEMNHTRMELQPYLGPPRDSGAYGRVFRVRCSPVPGASSGGGSYLKVTIQANGEAVITPEQ
jgi:hypothetical protein